MRLTPEWHPITTAPARKIVETKIDDTDGVRNIALLWRSGSLWFVPNSSMYVYYTPTHWRHANPKGGSHDKA